MSDNKQSNKILAAIISAGAVWLANKAVVGIWKKTV